MDDTTESRPPEQPNAHGAGGSEVVQSPPATSPIPTPGFSNLTAPDPVVVAPPESARAAAFAAILLGGMLGGLVGFGIGDVLYSDPTWSAVGALAGGLTGAIGLGVLANLTLRAMNEWKTASHPESGELGSSARPSGTKPSAS